MERPKLQADGTYADGAFHKHNQEVLAKIRAYDNIPDGFNEYVQNATADALAMIDAGASVEQIRSTIAAAASQENVDKACDAMVEHTTYKRPHK